MEISKAALPPRQPAIDAADRAHPLFPLYMQHRTFCTVQLIEASAFRDWLYQYEQQQRNESAAQHPQYPAFRSWMRLNQGGARRCPAGEFPHNFQYWLDGGRW